MKNRKNLAKLLLTTFAVFSVFIFTRDYNKRSHQRFYSTLKQSHSKKIKDLKKREIASTTKVKKLSKREMVKKSIYKINGEMGKNYGKCDESSEMDFELDIIDITWEGYKDFNKIKKIIDQYYFAKVVALQNVEFEKEVSKFVKEQVLVDTFPQDLRVDAVETVNKFFYPCRTDRQLIEISSLIQGISQNMTKSDQALLIMRILDGLFLPNAMPSLVKTKFAYHVLMLASDNLAGNKELYDLVEFQYQLADIKVELDKLEDTYNIIVDSEDRSLEIASEFYAHSQEVHHMLMLLYGKFNSMLLDYDSIQQ